jgi:hypothetical protein
MRLRQALTGMFGKPRALVQRMGLPDAIFELAGRALAACTFGRCTLRRYYVMAQPTGARPPVRAGRGASIVVRHVSLADDVTSRFPRPRAEVEERFASGSECLVAESGGELLGFMWLHFGAFLDPEVRVTFTPLPAAETSWDYDLYVAPASRTGFAFFRLWETADKYLVSRGVRWTVSRVWASNDESIRAHRRLGAFAIASASQLRIGGTTFTFADTSPSVQITRNGRAAVAAVNAKVAPRPAFARFAP